MKRFLLISCLLLSACTGLPSAVRNVSTVPASYDQVKRDIDHYKGVAVRWGGVIIDVENEEHASLVQVLFHPLDFSGRPRLNKPGEGRFVIKSAEFLDPAVYSRDREITVAGVIEGNIERTVGNRTIEVPLLSATAIYLWPNYYNPYYDYRGYGPYPFYGYPIYPGYYPYFWRGYYGPYLW